MNTLNRVRLARPSGRQLEYQDWELGLFLHFGIRTFYEGHRDWDGKPMTASGFNPKGLDCGQWAKTAAAAGVKYAVLTAKHHDGFALWPSRYTDYSVANTPWKNGKGDVVREYVEACRLYGVKVGLYYSPADANPRLYADGKEYDDYFIGQIGEILSGYGEIDVLWFDGCGSEGHEYDWVRITREIRSMQPNVLIFNMGDPDFRWIGNEAGMAPIPLWNTVDAVDFSVNTTEKQALAESIWLPAECDCMMRDVNWFYSDADEDTVKSVRELLGIYYLSVGRGANVLINIGPDRQGLLPKADCRSLLGLRAELDRRFGDPVATLDADAVSWQFSQPQRVDHIVLQEDLKDGEHIRRFAIDVVGNPHSQPITVWEGCNVGHKAICHFPQVKVKSLTVRILESNGAWSLRSGSVYQTER